MHGIFSFAIFFCLNSSIEVRQQPRSLPTWPMTIMKSVTDAPQIVLFEFWPSFAIHSVLRRANVAYECRYCPFNSALQQALPVLVVNQHVLSGTRSILNYIERNITKSNRVREAMMLESFLCDGIINRFETLTFVMDMRRNACSRRLAWDFGWTQNIRSWFEGDVLPFSK